MLRRNLGITLIAALKLALGIGVNTSMFTGLHSLLLSKLPYPETERVVQVIRMSSVSQSCRAESWEG